MTTPTVVVTINTEIATGVALAEGSVRFTPTALMVAGAGSTGSIVVAQAFDVPLDGSGMAAPNVVPNVNDQYQVEFFSSVGNRIGDPVLATIPNLACYLHDCFTTAAPQLSDAQRALDGAQAAQAAAQAAQAAAHSDRIAADADASATAADRVAVGSDRAAADADASATAADRIAVAADKASADADASATAADRVQTGLDRTQTGSDRTQTGLDRAATGADRTAVANDRAAADSDASATAADRVQTGLDRTATSASASAAAASAASAAHIIAGTFAPPTLATTRADGSALQAGDICFGTDGYEYAYIGAAWVNQTAAAAASAAAALASQGAASTSATNAATSATAASAAQTAAETARDQALTAGHIYQNTTDGLANTSGTGATNRYFCIPSASTTGYLDLYLNNGGSPLFVSTFPNATLVKANAGVLNVTTQTFGILTNTSNFAVGATYYGVRIPYTGAMTSLQVAVNAAGSGNYVVARRVLDAANSHKVESITAINYVSGINTLTFSPALQVTKGDIIYFQFSTGVGGGVKYTAAGANGGVTLSSPSVGGLFKAAAGNVTTQPSIQYTIVQFTGQQTQDVTLQGLESGTASSFAATTQVFGDSSVGSGSATGNANSRGPVAAAPAGLLTQYRWRTTSIGLQIDANVIVWAPGTDTTTNFTANKVIPVSVTTDGTGLAVASASDLGPVLVPEGSYIHVMGFDAASGVATYTADARAGTSATGGTSVTVGDVKAVAWFNVAYAADFTITTSDALTALARIGTNDNFRTLVSSSLGYENLKVGLISGRFDGVSNTAKAGYTIPRDGTITQFSVDLTAAGTGVLLYLKQINSNRYRVVTSTPYTTSNNGINTVTGLSIAASAGDMLAYVTLTGGFLRNNSTTGPTGIGIVLDSTNVGSVGRVGTPLNMGLQFVLNTPRVALLNATTKGGRMVSQGFYGTTLPSDWTTNGGVWTVSNGITPPATGGYSVYAINNLYTALGRRTLTMRVTVNDPASIFGLLANSNSGSIAQVDGTAGKLQIRTWTPSYSSSKLKEVVLPFALVAGRDIIVSLHKDNLTCTASAYDTVTQQSCSVTGLITDGYAAFQGKPGFVYVSGTTAPTLLWLDMDAPYKRWDIRTLVIGDSNGEGSNANLAGATPWPVSLQNNAAAGDVLQASQSGETSEFSYRMAQDLLRWNPRYVILALGTNDTGNGLNSWRANMSYAIEQIESMGAEAVLCTVIPKTGTSVPALMNADIKANYFGAHRFIDLASAVSVGNDGVTLNAAMYVGDGVHLNAAGHAASYAQVLTDGPYLLY